MDIYNAVSGITDLGVPAYMTYLVNGAHAEKAYKGFFGVQGCRGRKSGDRCQHSCFGAKW